MEYMTFSSIVCRTETRIISKGHVLHKQCLHYSIGSRILSLSSTLADTIGSRCHGVNLPEISAGHLSFSDHFSEMANQISFC